MDYTIVNHQHIFEPTKYFPQCHASTIEVLPDGTVITAWFGGTHEKADDVSIWLSRRENNGWSDPIIVAVADGAPCWNPVLFYTDNRLQLYYKRGKEIESWQTFIVESLDGGISWCEERELVGGDFGGRGPVKNKCIQLSDGTIIAPASVETKDNWVCFADISKNGGLSWTKGDYIEYNSESFQGLGLIQPTFWEDDDRIVHVLMRSTEGAIYKSKSCDGGASWDVAKRTTLPNNNCGIDLTRLSDGRLVLVYNPVAGNWAARSPIAFSVSCDNGESWSNPKILDHVECVRNEEFAEFSYPAIVSRGNRIYITYTWKRKTIAFWEIDIEEKFNTSNDSIKDGVWVTMVTPFTDDNKIDYNALEHLIEWYINKGVHGLFAVCQSSEMFFLSAEERTELSKFVVEKASGRVQVVASGHVANDVETQIDDLKSIQSTGVDAVVLVTNRLAKEHDDDEVWIANAEKIVNAMPNCKFGLYECPYPYKRLLSPRILEWCVKSDRFLFLKDTCCDIKVIKKRLEILKNTSLKLFNANDATLLASLRIGASGYCGVMSNFQPEIYVLLVEHFRKNRQMADKIHEFASISSLIELHHYPVNAKYHLNRLGLPININARVKDPCGLTDTMKTEVDALRGLLAIVSNEIYKQL